MDRRDLISFKLHAAVDIGGPNDVHFRDLLALAPTAAELQESADWVRTQDVGPHFPEQVDIVLAHARRELGYR